MLFRRIGLVVHAGRPAAVETAEVLRRWATEHDVVVIEIDQWSAGRLNAKAELAAAGHPTLIVAIGGDGTFLRGARMAAHADLPVLGVNVGRLGFLTDVEPRAVIAALDAIRAGQLTIDERLMLTARASRPLEVPTELQAMLRFGRGPLLPPPPHRQVSGPGPDAGVSLDVFALNDIVFEKLARDRQASLGVYLDEKLFASYSADALIVASPTGSTAYNFAAGGPILSPRLPGLVFTPVAAHMIFNRSVVLAADEAVSVRVLERSGEVAVSVDGQLRGVLDPGDWVTVLPARHKAQLVRLHPMNFYARLRDRFSLADAPAALADGAVPPMRCPDPSVHEAQ